MGVLVFICCKFSYMQTKYLSTTTIVWYRYLFMLTREKTTIGGEIELRQYLRLLHPLRMVFYYLVTFIDVFDDLGQVFHCFGLIGSIDSNPYQVSSSNT